MEKHQKEFFYTNLGLKGAPNGKSGFNGIKKCANLSQTRSLLSESF